MDALELLTADHNRVRGLFTRFKQAQETEDTATMATLATTIFEELQIHTTIEERSFYPSVRETDEELADIVNEGIEEHHVVDILMEEIKQLQPDDPQWVAKLTVLIENVEHHAEEEENEMFPKVRTATDTAVREKWGARLEEMKAELGAPTSADAQKFTLQELKNRAIEQQIPGRSTMDRDQLMATIDPR
jgi:hemerythrin superfamily protein